jgi:hypothetical protein
MQRIRESVSQLKDLILIIRYDDDDRVLSTFFFFFFSFIVGEGGCVSASGRFGFRVHPFSFLFDLFLFFFEKRAKPKRIETAQMLDVRRLFFLFAARLQ